MRPRLILAFVLCLGSVTLWAGSTPSPALLVLAKQDHTLEIVDPATLKVVAKVPAGNDPHEVAASSDGKLAYISNYGSGAFNTISVADLVAQRALPLVDLGPLRGPHGLDFAGGELYFTAEVNKVIGRLNPATRKIDWILGTGQDRTHMLIVSSGLTRIYTSNVNSGTISIIEKTAGNSGTPPPPPSASRRPGPPRGAQGWEETVLHTGLGTEGFDVSPDGRELWSAAAEAGTVSIINLATKKLAQTLDAHVTRANRLKFTPDGKYVFVSMLASNGGDVAIFDVATRREVKRLGLGRGAGGILMQPDGSRAYVSCSPDDYVAVIDLKTLKQVGRINTDRGPDGLAWAVRK
ncbi:MAG TPA: YncE family protein [Terriglobia bacterium]|nr:YncE family protein [Terriglobia bacterium]